MRGGGIYARRRRQRAMDARSGAVLSPLGSNHDVDAAGRSAGATTAPLLGMGKADRPWRGAPPGGARRRRSDLSGNRNGPRPLRFPAAGIDGRRRRPQAAYPGAGAADRGAPTVILEAGTAEASPAWALILSALAPETRVCAYDRAGNGWSEPGPEPRDAKAIVADLHTLLARAEVRGPFVLVGHSFGGMYIRAYREAFPDEVAGLAAGRFIAPGSTHPSPERSAKIATFMSVLRIAPWLARVWRSAPDRAWRRRGIRPA